MKKELNANELKQVTGGTTIITDKMHIGFDTSLEMFDLVGCTYREARDFAEDLLAQNPNMGNAEFDAFCKQQFAAKGWIDPTKNIYNP